MSNEDVVTVVADSFHLKGVVRKASSSTDFAVQFLSSSNRFH